MPDPTTPEDVPGMARVIQLGWFLAVTAGRWVKEGKVDVNEAKKASAVIRVVSQDFLEKLIEERNA